MSYSDINSQLSGSERLLGAIQEVLDSDPPDRHSHSKFQPVVREVARLGLTLLWPVVVLYSTVFWWSLGDEFSGRAALAFQAAYVVLAVFVFLPKAIRQAIQEEFPRFHLAIRRPETAHGAGREPSVATVKRRSGAVLGLSLSDQYTEDPSRSMKYRESLRLSIQVAICTAGLAAVPLGPLGWLREFITAGQNPGQIILKVVFVIAFLSLPFWAAWALLLDFSKAFSLRVVRTDAIEAQET